MVTGGSCFASRTGSHCVTQFGLKFMILLPQVLKHLDYRSTPLLFPLPMSPLIPPHSNTFQVLVRASIKVFDPF